MTAERRGDASQVEPQLRASLPDDAPSRFGWVRIAGPLAALIIGALGALLYLHPVGVLRWMQVTRLGWSGVGQKEIALNDGLMTFLMTGGYAGQDPVVLGHG